MRGEWRERGRVKEGGDIGVEGSCLLAIMTKDASSSIGEHVLLLYITTLTMPRRPQPGYSLHLCNTDDPPRPSLKTTPPDNARTHAHR